MGPTSLIRPNGPNSDHTDHKVKLYFPPLAEQREPRVRFIQQYGFSFLPQSRVENVRVGIASHMAATSMLRPEKFGANEADWIPKRDRIKTRWRGGD
ncbi:hypothetical protein BaRGS_00027639 [Batillaria attramentaria]|uniref:Uncharacterized protein n=1 Tax=Batillaria attramentaria TaxID=370345 RepID=A0ABD0K1I0_9CAEN